MEETNTPSTGTEQASVAPESTGTTVDAGQAAASESQQGQVAATTESGTTETGTSVSTTSPESNYSEVRSWATKVSQENARLKAELASKSASKPEVEPDIPIPQEFQNAPKEQQEAWKTMAKTFVKAAEARAKDMIARELEPIRLKSYQEGSMAAIERARKDLPNFKDVENTPEIAMALNKLAGANMTQWDKIQFSYNQVMAEMYRKDMEREKQVTTQKKTQSSNLERPGVTAPNTEPTVKKYKRISDAYSDVRNSK